MSLILQTAPASDVYPVSLSLVKSNSVVEHTLDDTLLTFYMGAATQYVETVIERDIVSRTWDYSFDKFPNNDIIVLPRGPVLGVTSITYYDYAGSPVLNTVDLSKYTLDKGVNPAEIRLAYGETWPAATYTHNSITVRYTSGYIDASSSPVDDSLLPETIKQAVLMVVDDMYRNRASQDTIKLYKNEAVDMMLTQNRSWL